MPFVTLAGWEVISALAGYTVVVETVFAWPGLGLDRDPGDPAEATCSCCRRSSSPSRS